MKRKILKTYSNKKKLRFGNSKAKENLGIELNDVNETIQIWEQIHGEGGILDLEIVKSMKKNRNKLLNIIKLFRYRNYLDIRVKLLKIIRYGGSIELLKRIRVQRKKQKREDFRKEKKIRTS